MENNEHYEQEIDLFQLIKMLMMRWYIVAFATVVILTATIFYAFVMQDDVYTAESSMLVQVESNQSQSDAVSFQLGQRLVDTYTEIAKSNLVINQLKTNLGLNYSNARIRNMINIAGVRDTIVIKIQVESGDPEEATLIANELLDIIKTLSASPDFTSLQNIDVLDIAAVPMTPSGPNRVLYLAIGLILGVMIGVFAVFMMEFFDKTIKTTRDMEAKLDLRVLGLIPDYRMEDEVEE